MESHLESVSEISLEVARPILTLPPSLRLRKPIEYMIARKTATPLPRKLSGLIIKALIRYTALNFSRYAAAT